MNLNNINRLAHFANLLMLFKFVLSLPPGVFLNIQRYVDAF